MRGTRMAALAAVTILGTGCGVQSASDQVSAEDAVLCRELGGDVIHIRFETDDGLVVRNQRRLELEDAGAAQGLSPEARRVLEARGWGEEELEELVEPRELSTEVEALLDEMPSCLEELREQNDG